MDKTEIISRLIKDTGMSVRAFSEKAGLPYTTVRSILERGIENSSVNKVIRICEALGISIDELLRRERDNEDIECITTIAAHHEGDWSQEELEEIERFKEFVKSKRQERKGE